MANTISNDDLRVGWALAVTLQEHAKRCGWTDKQTAHLLSLAGRAVDLGSIEAAIVEGSAKLGTPSAP